MSNPPTRNCRLLIVDDNRAIHEDFQKILGPKPELSGGFDEAEAALFGEAPAKKSICTPVFELDFASQGEQALEMVKQALSKGKPYAMAFMDVRMPPGWDGIETTAKIWEVDPDLQVVVCTAYSDCSWDEMLDKLERSDRLVILKKPFDSVEVLQLANSLTRKWELLRELKNKMANLEKTADRPAVRNTREITTATAHVGDKMRFIEESFVGLGKLLRDHQKLVGVVQASEQTAQMIAAAESASEKNNIAHLIKEIPVAIQQSLGGVERVVQIVRALKEFSRPDGKAKAGPGLNHRIETTLTTARSE